MVEVPTQHVGPLPGIEPVADYRPLLEGTGLVIEHYTETPGWSRRLTNPYRRRVMVVGSKSSDRP